MLIFGSADGKVYCLDASTGAMGWSFLAAPEERLISVFGKLESTWPVHGSVIIKNGEVVSNMAGARPKAALQSWIEESI